MFFRNNDSISPAECIHNWCAKNNVELDGELKIKATILKIKEVSKSIHSIDTLGLYECHHEVVESSGKAIITIPIPFDMFGLGVYKTSIKADFDGLNMITEDIHIDLNKKTKQVDYKKMSGGNGSSLDRFYSNKPQNPIIIIQDIEATVHFEVIIKLSLAEKPKKLKSLEDIFRPYRKKIAPYSCGKSKNKLFFLVRGTMNYSYFYDHQLLMKPNTLHTFLKNNCMNVPNIFSLFIAFYQQRLEKLGLNEKLYLLKDYEGMEYLKKLAARVIDKEKKIVAQNIDQALGKKIPSVLLNLITQYDMPLERIGFFNTLKLQDIDTLLLPETENPEQETFHQRPPTG